MYYKKMHLFFPLYLTIFTFGGKSTSYQAFEPDPVTLYLKG